MPQRLLNLVPAALAFAVVAGTGFAQGGYFPDAWGWATLGCATVAFGVLLTRDRLALSTPALLLVTALALFALWSAASAFWSVSATDSVLEAERVTVYAAAGLAAVLLARDHAERLLHGVLAAVFAVSGWALLTRLVPDRWGVVDAFSGERLSGTIGYWNGLGAFAAMGTLLAVGVAARGRTHAGRCLAAVTVPILVTTLYFTYSRGAWAVLVLGLVASLWFDPRRAQMLATVVTTGGLAAVCVWRAAVSPALTTTGAPIGEAAHEGHRVLLVVAAAAVVAAILQLGAWRLDPGPRVRRRLAALGALAAAGLIAVAIVEVGSPPSIGRKAWNGFTHGSVSGSPSLNGRLFHLNGTGREVQWRVAVHQAGAYPLLGSGAGTYEIYWNRHRTDLSKVINVHELYLEELADLGPLGLALILAIVLVPLAAAGPARRRPLAPAAFGAFAAFALHGLIDWDWQLPALTITALACAAMLVTRPGGRSVRVPAIALTTVLALTGLYVVASRIPLDRMQHEASQRSWDAARRDAGRAADLAPWSSEPWISLGEDEYNADRGDLAHPLFETAARKDPNDWVAWYDLARGSEGPEFDRAIRNAHRLNPLSPEVAAIGQ